MKNNRLVFVFVCALVCSLSLSASLSAQTNLASVTGRVFDPNAAVIVEATVTARDVDKGIEITVQTNEEGIYHFASLAPGNYEFSVSKRGFKVIVKPAVTLHVADTVSMNFTMQVGDVKDIVVVEGGAPLLNTESAIVSTVVDRKFAENLPMNGRSFQTLIQLAPGVVLTANNGQDTGQFSVNGQRASSNYWMVDGVSANTGISAFATTGNGLGGSLGSSSVFGGTNSLVSVDALQEFRIQTSTFAPEFGRTPGGQISIVTRSGASQFHGAVFDYLRNDVLDANDWFANSKGLAKPKERQNDFGGMFSGPIFKDRAFFFFSYEGLRLRLPQTALTNVPDLNARQSAVPAMQPYLNAFPLPNGADNVATGVAQFNSSLSNPGTLDTYSLRIDHRLNDKLSLFGRYNYSPSALDQRGLAPFALSVVSASQITTQTATIGVTLSISPIAANDFRFNFSSTDSSSSFNTDNFGGAVPLASLPFPSAFTAQNAQLAFIILSLGSSSGFALDVGKNAHNRQRQLNVVDSESLQKDSHSLKVGVDFRRLSPQFGVATYGQTPLFFSVPAAETGNAFLNILFSRREANFLFRNLGVFAQDTWRIAPRLTLTYGLRWDIDFVPSPLNGPGLNAVTGFNINDLSRLALAPAGTAPFITRYGNVAPRVGIAYQALQSQRWQTVIRGGFGVFYDLATAEVGNLANFNAYPFAALGFVSGNFPLTPAAAVPPPITLPGPNSLLQAFDPSLQSPYALQWNVAMEQVLGGRQTITASYIGSVGRRLTQTALIFKPNLNYGSAQLVTNRATSNYNALQLQFQRRLSRGLQALASYTWAHSIDTASAGSIGNGANDLAGLSPNANRGPSDFDVRNSFSLGLTYDVPAPKINALANALLRGWSTENIVHTWSAPPVNVYYSSFTALSSGFATQVRADVVTGNPFYLYGPQYPGGKALNPTAFTTPAAFPFGQGSLGRNTLRGFGANQWDFAVHRDFAIHEAVKLQLRAEMFNVLNHPNFGMPVSNLGSPTVLNPQFGLSMQMLGRSLGGGIIGNGAINPLYQIGSPRSIQFALKLMF